MSGETFAGTASAGTGRDPDFIALMPSVARALLGDPNRQLSNRKELRFGTRGSLSVDLEAGRWFDHEAGTGGGVLDLIKRETGRDGRDAMDWLRDRGLVSDARGGHATREARNERSQGYRSAVPHGGGGKPRPRIVATYDYHDEAGNLLYQVARLEPKDFRQRRPDGNGWSWSVKGVRRVLYRLPQILDAAEDAIVFVVEGEKDADRLAGLGLNATTAPGGAGKWSDAYADQLSGVRVVALADNDDPGRRHAEAVVASFRARGTPAAVLTLDGLPPKGDVSDWLDAGRTAEDLIAKAEAAPFDDAPEAGDTGDPLAALAFTAADLDGRTVPPREWHVDGLVPAKTVTLLTGDGGTGKSLLALQLAVATAAGRRWIGHEVREGGALVLSAEDDRDELHRRLAAITRREGPALADLSRLTLASLAGADALLAIEHKGVLAPTPLFEAIDARLASERPVLLVLDTLADLFPGNENDRAQARQFIGMLRGLAIRHGCAVLLLSHPSLHGLGSGSGTSGSTAWSNSVRSRIYLERVTQDGYEADPDARVLRTMKSNYCRTGAEAALIWKEGVFATNEPEGGLDRMAANAKAERVFLKLLRTFHEQGRHVSPAPSNAYAPKVFSEHPDAEGMSKGALKGAMENLFIKGKIVVARHGSGGKARSHVALAEDQEAAK